MSTLTLVVRRRSQSARRIALLVGIVSALAFRPDAAIAHPLGNFTTNTATHVTLTLGHVDVVYVVDLAEIPALKIRQELGASSGPVPPIAADRWRDERCKSIAQSLDITRSGVPVPLAPTGGAQLSFPSGQAGLTTLRLECRLHATSGESSPASVNIVDRNYPDRLGWREISVSGNGVGIDGEVATVSPTDLLLRYPKEAVSAPLRQLGASFKVSRGAAAEMASASDSATASPAPTNRGNDGLTQRFQSLLDHRKVTLPFAAGAMLLAVVLGGLHALAPGHGKTIIAAYALGRRGRTADIIAIGGTVAATHTVGIMVLGVLVSATTVVSADRSVRWASVVSGVLVIGVGFTLLRTRLAAWRRPGRHGVAGWTGGHDHPHPHPHPQDHDHGHAHPHPKDQDHAHDDGHDHPHPHDHDHGHDHPHPEPHDHEHAVAHHDDASVLHDPHPLADAHAHVDTPGRASALTADAATRAHPDDPRFIVTSHAHGGWSHDHVLPAPGSVVRRRELVMMGLAGGLVPSPSALVVLLGAIAVGRVPFGVALVVAYGIGLAATLVGAGLLIVRFERGVRGWSSRLSTPAGARLHAVTNALPLVSGFAIAGAGVLLLARSVAQL